MHLHSFNKKTIVTGKKTCYNTLKRINLTPLGKVDNVLKQVISLVSLLKFV